MPVRVTCPACQTVYNLGDPLRGKVIPCPRCQQPIQVGDPEPPRQPSASARAGRPAEAPRPQPPTPVRRGAPVLLIACGVLAGLFLVCGAGAGVGGWLLWRNVPGQVQVKDLGGPVAVRVPEAPPPHEQEARPERKAPEPDPAPAVPKPPAAEPPPPPAGGPAVLEADRVVRELAAPAADVAPAGAGRYLVLSLPTLRKLAVFDCSEIKVVRYLPMEEEQVLFTAGVDSVVVALPGKRQLQRWSLTTFERDLSVPLGGLVGTDPLKDLCMGSASDGPVLLLTERQTVVLDGALTKQGEVSWRMWQHNGGAWGPTAVRAAADGSAVVAWGGGWAGLEVATVGGGKVVDVKSRYEVPVGQALPSADGRQIFASYGLLTPELSQVPAGARPDSYLFPAATPGFFLGVKQPPVPLPELTVYTADQRLVSTFAGLEELQGTTGGWEKRVHFLPAAELLVTVPPGRGQLVLRRFRVTEALEQAGIDYLLVVSQPPRTAKPGAAYTYRIVVRSKKGGVKYRVESGPPGMTVAADGRLTWPVPADFDQAEVDVIVAVSDAGGQETFHTFRIHNADAARAARAGPPMPPAPAPPPPPAPAPAVPGKADVRKLQVTLPPKWKGQVDKEPGGPVYWLFEKEGDGAHPLLVARLVGARDPATLDAYLKGVKDEPSCLPLGRTWVEVTEKKERPDGFFVAGTAKVAGFERDCFVLVRTIDGQKVLIFGEHVPDPGDRKAALEVAESARFGP